MNLRFTWAPSPRELADAARRAARDEENSGVSVRLVSEKDRVTEDGKVRRQHHRLIDAATGEDLDDDEARRRIDPYVKRPRMWRYTEEWRRLPAVSVAAILDGCLRVQMLRDSVSGGLILP